MNLARFICPSFEGPDSNSAWRKNAGAGQIPEPASLLILLYRHLTEDGNAYSAIAVETLLDELDALFREDKIQFELHAPVRSLKMPENVTEIKLDSNTKICALSLKESENIYNGDEIRKPRGIPQRVTTGIRIAGFCPIAISLIHQITPENSMHDDTEAILRDVISALMIIASGKPSLEFRDIRYPRLPITYGITRRSTIEISNPYGDMELKSAHIEPLKAIYKKVRSNKNRQISIALDRLTRSESRHAAIDGIIDAVIGLEALLTPTKAPELIFRAKLHYALIGPFSERMERFTKLGKIIETRSTIVHGNEPKKADLEEVAGSARICLREVLLWCLNQNSLTQAGTISDRFWIDYVMSLGASTSVGALEHDAG